MLLPYQCADQTQRAPATRAPTPRRTYDNASPDCSARLRYAVIIFVPLLIASVSQHLFLRYFPSSEAAQTPSRQSRIALWDPYDAKMNPNFRDPIGKLPRYYVRTPLANMCARSGGLAGDRSDIRPNENSANEAQDDRCAE
jgi:hypothetical protein